ncbi:MAG: glycosyltransferase [Bacteroidaceae bacterium]|nr:glycosyltransferase [Bacteroidaceae bacterium]
MTTPLVSIIVAVYNAEKYIRQCIDSILAQTHSNIEIILIDDGSNDNSGIICDDYAKNDCRIKVIHQENGGVSIARQTGANNAIGEYSIHVDPDDWVEPNMIEEMVAKAEIENADMVICDFYRETKTKRTYESQNPGNDLSAIAVLRKILLQQLHGSCWNKLVRRDSITGVSFYPDDLCILEDELYNIRLLSRNIKVTYLPKAFYHYRIDNEQSVCFYPSEHSFNSKIKAIGVIEDFCKNNIPQITSSDFIPIKSNVLFDALVSKRYEHLKNLYPDLNKSFIAKGTPYKITTPVSSCIALALKGFPSLAHRIYFFNMWLLTHYQSIKSYLK